ncbi:PAS domain S-box-containing protein/diguanylate cyclase (GGDEF) domain-containing protein [Granulicella pectinivorans]|uniref:PAS domain S-box-containing protein/diguanylate cyclase (GGDEF) domain-containing protein n=1 Tax=Granulicella pectinivorans TaxID=474950 RepID=A0A1I6MXS5_9BACT|nr:GGDEF domain-containing protein [Granulicella pectinivorans]SFS20464.1 PAS domain S-box-containing protein/diguanylate cyclase (GGDEF) domain-containing protein [Granulicella pectinivorans]
MDDLRAEILRGTPLPEEWNWSRQIIESVVTGITVSDLSLPDSPLVYVNPAFERMTGYTSREVLGRNCRFLQGTDRNQPGLVHLRNAVREGTPITTVLRNYRKDGTPFWNELYLSPIRDLTGCVTHFVGIQNDVTRRVELEGKLAYMSQHDILTGLPNRAVLMEKIDQAIQKAEGNRRLVGVLFLDLDNFKTVNDMFGHDAGDGLLRIIAERLRIRMRGTETAARLSGDEFVVVLENLRDEFEAKAILERLSQDIHRPLQLQGQDFLPSCSIGVALYPRDGKTAEELLKSADMSMYLNKHIHHQKAPGPSRLSRSS